MSPIFEILARRRDTEETSAVSEPFDPEVAPLSGDGDPCAAPAATDRVGPLLYEAKRAWDPDRFAEQQILNLIQTVFFPGWPHPSRQVVFSSVDPFLSAGSACAQVALMMAKHLPGTVCAVEADCNDPALECAIAGGKDLKLISPSRVSRSARQLQENLWLLGADEFFKDQKTNLAEMRRRLSDLRREFNYTVIHAPAVGASSQSGMLAQVADGIVLVLHEGKTRRATAVEAKAVLQAANARLIGVVIEDRQFPIPERIYQKL